MSEIPWWIVYGRTSDQIVYYVDDLTTEAEINKSRFWLFCSLSDEFKHKLSKNIESHFEFNALSVRYPNTKNTRKTVPDVMKT